MKRTAVRFASGFHVLAGDADSQAASRIIPPRGSEGGPDNLHKGADQWLYVESGSGEAIVNGHHYKLERGSLLLIQRGDEIRNSKRTPLKTLNFYVPPAYSSDGDELQSVKPS